VIRPALSCLMLAVIVGTSHACLCRDDPVSVQTLRFRSSDVFVGRVLSVTASGVVRRGQVFIERSWKGVQAGATVVVATLGQGVTCGVQFRSGDRLLVFARPDSGDEKGTLWAWRCERSTAVPLEVAALSDSLGAPSSIAKSSPRR